MGGTKKTSHTATGQSAPPAWVETLFDDFLARLEDKLNDPHLNRYDVVRDTLYQIYLGTVPNFARVHDYTFPVGARVLMACFDPRNVTLESERHPEVIADLYAERKPLIWFWQLFDRSPLGLNDYLGFRLRQILAPYIFKHVGKDFRCAPFVRWRFGYHLSLGDGVTIGSSAWLDDRGELEIGPGVTIGEGAIIYSHAPELRPTASAHTQKTVIEEGAEIGAHSTLWPGIRIGAGARVQPASLVTQDVPPHHLAAGAPAEIRPLPPGPSDATPRT